MATASRSQQVVGTSPYRWTILALLLPLQFVMGLNFFGPSTLFPMMMDEFQISRGSVSLLVVAVTLAQTFFLIPGGLLAARLGSRRAITLSGVLVGLGIIGGTGPSFPVLVFLRVLFGIGASILLPATNTVIVQWFNSRQIPYINGVTLAIPGMGVASAMGGSVLIANAYGWEGVFFIYGALTLVATAAWGTFAKEVPRGGQPISAPPLGDLLGVIKERNTVLLAIASMGPLALFVALSAWLPTYYNEVFHMPLAQASAIVTIIPILGSVVNAASGFILQRLGLRKPVLIIPCLLLPVVALGLFYVNSQPVIIGSIILFGLLSSIFMPALFTIIMELPGMTPEKVALVTSAVLTLGNLATAISPVAVGATTDAFNSYSPSFTVLAILPLVTAAVGVLLPETGAKAGERQTAAGPAVPAR